MNANLRPVAIFSVLVLTSLTAPAAAQTTYAWNNSGTNWGAAANWSPSGTPGGNSADIAQLNLGAIGATTLNDPTLGSSTSIRQVSFADSSAFQGWTLSGSGTLTAGSSTVSGLVSRGSGAYSINLGSGSATSLTLTGATGSTTTGGLNLGSGSTVTLTGNTIASLGSSAIAFRGGTLVLDNAAGNPSGGQRLAGSGQINLTGGGSVLELRGASAGTSFTGLSGVLSAGSGGSTVRIVQPNGASGATSATFGSLARGNSSAAVNFASSGSGTLGGGGATDPSIKFTTAPALTNNVISSGVEVGFATYNGTDFASYDSTKGVIAVTATNVSGTLSSAAAQNSNLTGSATIGAATTVAYNTLKISPSASGQSLAIGTGGVLNTPAILLTGTTNYSITGGSITGAATRNFAVTNPNTTLTISSNLASALFPINKSGDGFLTLSGTSNQIGFASLQSVNLLGGTMRVNSTNFNLTPATAPLLRFRGGVIEYDVSGANFTFSNALGTISRSVNWSQGAGPTTNTGSGGFSAYAGTTNGGAGNGNVFTVNLGGSGATVTWGGQTGTDANFVQDGYALKFGSTKSNATLAWHNPIALDVGNLTSYAVREINVTCGVGNAADKTQVLGGLSGSPSTDLLKTGTGVLELLAANTYQGNTLVQGGTLVVGDGGSLGTGDQPTGSIVVGKGATFAGVSRGGSVTVTGSSTSVVNVNPGGAIRGGNPTVSGDGLAALVTNANVVINSNATDSGILRFEASRTGTGTASASLINVTDPNSVFNLNPGNGNQFVIDLVNGSSALQLNETYTVTLATVATAGNIQLNGSTLAANATVGASNYTLQSSAFAAFTNVALTVDGAGTSLQLTFTPVPVPEPAAVLAIATGALLLGRTVRRKVAKGEPAAAV